MRYGLLSYAESMNLGDEIQSLAARRFLPRVDFTVDREALPDLRLDGPASLILNGWFMHHPERWPPPEGLRPLLVSMHVSRDLSHENRSGLTPDRLLLTGAGAEYLRRWGPVGARDWHTLELLDRAGIPAWWSACLTLTLERPPAPREDLVCAVDLGPAMIEQLQARLRTPLRVVSHLVRGKGTAEKLAAAERRLQLYARAKAVVTTRLHCALPCLALGTPVLFVERAADAYRFDGLRDLLHHVDRDGFLAGRHGFDCDAPPENPGYHRRYRDRLVEEATRFIAAAGG
ncbi:MAG: polysaccharide pyruvyl transferase family protein [Dongiaceae bacterium]